MRKGCGIVAAIRNRKSVRPQEGSTEKEKIVTEDSGIPSQPSPSEPPPFQPVATPQYQPVASSYQPPPPPPAMGQPVAAKSGGTSAVKIILIIVAIFVGLAIMALGVVGYGVWRVSRAIHRNIANGSMTINTPGGPITTSSTASFTADELGTDIYPGAQPAKSGSMKMHLPTGAMISATFLTTDPKDKVIAFYKEKLGSGATAMEFGDNAMLSLQKGDHDHVTVTVSQQANQSDGKTQIHIQHITNTQSK